MNDLVNRTEYTVQYVLYSDNVLILYIIRCYINIYIYIYNIYRFIVLPREHKIVQLIILSPVRVFDWQRAGDRASWRRYIIIMLLWTYHRVRRMREERKSLKHIRTQREKERDSERARTRIQTRHLLPTIPFAAYRAVRESST